MPPSEDAALLMQIVERHLKGMALTMQPDYPDEDWGFSAQQAVEKLLKALIVLAAMARQLLSGDLLNLQVYAVEARYRPGPFPLPASREALRREIEAFQAQVGQKLAAQQRLEQEEPA